VLFRAANVCPDHLHRLSTDIYSMAASEDAGCFVCLAAAMNADTEVDVTDKKPTQSGHHNTQQPIHT
jgi:hypothetical protein